MNNDRRTIIINGAGIAGLTAALCIADNTDYRVQVFERTKRFEAVGAGIQISPNAFHVLAELGLEKQLKAIATAPDAINIFNANSGKLIKKLPLGHHMIKRYGMPYLVIYRPDLQNLLVSACRERSEIEITMDSEVVDVASHANGITALVKQNGGISEVAGKGLIIADGIWSKLREQVMELPKGKYSGTVAWRTMLPMDTIDEIEGIRENTTLWLAPGAHVVMYPVRGGQYLNVVAILADDNPNPHPMTLNTRLAGWGSPLSNIMQQDTKWSAWPVYEMAKIKPMHSGPVCITGDAAHAMLPYAAQGAAMAIEDGYALGHQLQHNEEIAEAFKQFQKQRLSRISRTMRLAKSNRNIYHMGKFNSLFRDIGMRLTPASLLLSRQDWLYGWRPS